jgi:hypothetical protein
MAKLGERSRQLAYFGLDEKLLRGLFTSKDVEDAVWLAEHELKEHIKWAQERHAFLLSEIERAHPGIRALPPTQGPPLQSHRGRNGNRSQLFGETLG